MGKLPVQRITDIVSGVEGHPGRNRGEELVQDGVVCDGRRSLPCWGALQNEVRDAGATGGILGGVVDALVRLLHSPSF